MAQQYLITDTKLNTLANNINATFGTTKPMTLDTMATAISNITSRDSTSLTVSEATVTVPAGYYSTQASKSVASGAEGTPTATKGTVSDHSVSVTPSVTNTAGYISGGTKTGTATSVSASELVSGTLNITSSGTKDVTNYASASVSSGSAAGPSSISQTGASVTTGTNTITLTKTNVSTTPTVSAGYVASATSSTATVALTATVTTKAAATYRASTSQQTIASGTYLVGTQTIAPVSQTNLTAENIKSGTTISISNGESNIWSVLGTYTGGGGASNIIEGTFTTGSSAGASSVNLSYTGSGYPIAAMVFVDGGAYNTAISGWYNSVQRYAVGQWTMSKAVITSTPTYTTSGTQNTGVTTAIYKNSTSSSTSYTRTSAMNSNVYSSSNASNAALTCVRFKTGNVLSYYVNTSSYGLLPSTKYKYIIIYSS